MGRNRRWWRSGWRRRQDERCRGGAAQEVLLKASFGSGLRLAIATSYLCSGSDLGGCSSERIRPGCSFGHVIWRGDLPRQLRRRVSEDPILCPQLQHRGWPVGQPHRALASPAQGTLFLGALRPHRRNAGSQSDAWQNEWIAAPGAGLQLFPFSEPRYRGEHTAVGAWLGPLRAFGEYNFNDYWGATNTWRPRNQVLAGFDYWKAAHVNDLARAWWTEIWNGLYWQSSNEFTDRYDSIVFANSVRLGARAPNRGMLSALTPYLLAQSSRTKYNKPGQTTDFYWENSFIGGGGMRMTPSLHAGPEGSRGITRFVIYGEYLDTAVYYGPVAPPTVPRYDIRVGVGVSIADWFK